MRIVVNWSCRVLRVRTTVHIVKTSNDTKFERVLLMAEQLELESLEPTSLSHEILHPDTLHFSELCK